MTLAADDLIVAPATPPGRGALAVVRVSGSGALELAGRLTGRPGWVAQRASRARVRLPGGHEEDAVVTAFVGPRSFTGQDVVEFSVHGSPVIVEALTSACLSAGARLALPGEFTYRAYLNGRLDLIQAEAIADLVDATTVTQARVASAHLDGTLSRDIVGLGDRLASLRALLEASLDFPDEGFHFVEPSDVAATLSSVRDGCRELLRTSAAGQRLRDGALVVIAGRPNAGKSTLFNALLGRPRAIVASVAGTTRDLLMEPVEIGGIPVRLVDTAGLRASDDEVEAEGVSRAAEAVAAADIVVWLVDGAADEREQAAALREFDAIESNAVTVVAVSKADVWQARETGPAWCRADAVAVSSRSDAGLSGLRERLSAVLGVLAPAGAILTRARHRSLIETCEGAVSRAMVAAGAGASEEYVLADVLEALEALALLRGVEAPEEVLSTIFSQFCIGK